MHSLDKKLIIPLVFGASSLFMPGCATPNQSSAAILAARGAAAIAPGAIPSEGYLGLLLAANEIERRDNNEALRRAAEAGRPGTNTYGRGYDQPYRESYRDQVGRIWTTKRDLVFAANKWKDYNGNGSYDFNEFDGVKTVFTENEPVLAFAKINLRRGNKVSSIITRVENHGDWGDKLLNPKKREAFFEAASFSGNQIYTINVKEHLDSTWHHAGVYDIHFYVNGKWAGGIRYQIIK